MQSVTSNAVASKTANYNNNPIYFSETIQTAIRTAFNNTANYRIFTGYTTSSFEGSYWGFKHTTYGSGIFISRGELSFFYLDANTFRTKVIMSGL